MASRGSAADAEKSTEGRIERQGRFIGAAVINDRRFYVSPRLVVLVVFACPLPRRGLERFRPTVPVTEEVAL